MGRLIQGFQHEQWLHVPDLENGIARASTVSPLGFALTPPGPWCMTW